MRSNIFGFHTFFDDPMRYGIWSGNRAHPLLVLHFVSVSAPYLEQVRASRCELWETE